MFAPRGRRSEGYFWWGCVVVIGVQIGAGIAIVVSLNMQCIPHSAIWDITILATSKCFDLYKLQVASASIQLISDVAILLLPQQVIWSLKMTWRKRMGVSFIFGLGLLACISAVFRLETTIMHGKSADAVWTLPPLAFWATAEMTCGFFIVSLPCIPKIMMETGAGTKIKSIFGMSSLGNSSKRNWESEGTGQSSNQSKLARSTTDNTYYKLDTLKSSESTEYLQKGTLTQDEDRRDVYP
ncbi:Serine hydrolase FSH [Penicillium concentricum]|uniref:Serine hydrolase FSH n=1 Tax=Penicillium concentricum TaxID=293559 RepID=A0A9W9SBI6_9EURO|nr:Serine hydrolase FSH [Penicillium concentricum]KAJ5375606.1 Serine hydrolase FSH [Penicillium concentricum]